MNDKYLIQYEVDGNWYTCAKRGTFGSACAKARSEWRAMKAAHDVSVIRDKDPEILRRTMENNFKL